MQPGNLDDIGVGHGVRVVAAEDLDVLAHPKHFGGPASLQHHASAQARGMIARVGAKDAHDAGGWRTETHEKLDRRGLSRSVGTQQSNYLAAAKRKREIVEGDDTVGKSLGDVIECGDSFNRRAWYRHCKGRGNIENCAHGSLLGEILTTTRSSMEATRLRLKCGE